MSSPVLEEPWGQLVALEGGSERIPIIGEKFTIGRRKDVDVAVTDNKFVSNSHCSLLYDGEGDIWLKDTSTNGTLVNGNKVLKEKVKLIDGCVIKVVFRKDNPGANLSYRFVDLRPELVKSIESDATLEMTQEYDEIDTIDDNNRIKRKATEKLETEPELKKPAMEEASKKENVTKENENINKKEDVPQKPDLEKKDSIEETLTCQICQEILHDCVSLQPCMHSYCGGCYSDWMEYSKLCPACRGTVERISKNHIVNNLVDAYLRAHPDKKRPEEDIKDLDARNKITKDMLYPKSKRTRHYCSSDEDEEEEEDEDSSDTSDDSDSSIPPLATATPFGSSLAAPITLCRQCPGYVDATSSLGSSDFSCSTNTNHVLCLCCLQPMPDRRTDPDFSIPPQKCDVCSKAYCHMYWGCRKYGCRGCLNLFKDMDFSGAVMDGIINDNYYESEVLKNYIRQKDLTAKDVLQACMSKLDDGDYNSSDSRTTRISSSTRTCYTCALRNFKDLVYQYREDIPSDDLPGEVTRRHNCYYGKNCRTQKHNREHAKTYNHICEQTRF